MRRDHPFRFSCGRQSPPSGSLALPMSIDMERSSLSSPSGSASLSPFRCAWRLTSGSALGGELQIVGTTYAVITRGPAPSVRPFSDTSTFFIGIFICPLPNDCTMHIHTVEAHLSALKLVTGLFSHRKILNFPFTRHNGVVSWSLVSHGSCDKGPIAASVQH